MDEHMAEPFCRDEPMERFLNALLDGISYTNEDGIVVYANNAYYTLTGLSAADILGRSIYELVESGFPVSRMVLDVFQTRQTKTESIQYGSDENHEILVSAIPIYDDKGIFRGAATIFGIWSNSIPCGAAWEPPICITSSKLKSWIEPIFFFSPVSMS
jgi:PAS domain S-box-containing protein